MLQLLFAAHFIRSPLFDFEDLKDITVYTVLLCLYVAVCIITSDTVKSFKLWASEGEHRSVSCPERSWFVQFSGVFSAVCLCASSPHTKNHRRHSGSKARLENKRGGEDSGEQIKAPGAAGAAAGENQTFGANFFTMVRDQRQRGWSLFQHISVKRLHHPVTHHHEVTGD